MFAYRASEDIRINNYDEAARMWRNAKEHRQSHVSNDRQLDGKKKWVGIRKDHNDAIRCRYHSTDVVIFHCDGQVDVDCRYPSRSTNNFIYEVLGTAGFAAESNSYLPTVAWIGQGWADRQGWLVEGDVATFDLTGEAPVLINPLPMLAYAAKPKVMKELRKRYGVEDFAVWRKMHIAIHGEPNHGYKSRKNPAHRPNNIDRDMVVEMLGERENWSVLAYHCTLNWVKDAVYKKHPECVAVVNRGPFQGYTDYQNWKKRDAQYGWAKR